MVDYERYYRNQAGGGGNFFKGAPIQRGYGLGNILGGLFRAALPILKQGATTLGKQALRTGVNIASDALNGQHVQSAAKERLRQAGRQITNRAANHLSQKKKTTQRNKGLKRRARSTSRIKAADRGKKRTLDIFDY